MRQAWQALWKRDLAVGFLAAALIIGLVATATYLTRGVLPYPSDQFQGWDHHRYIGLAQTPLSANPELRVAPFVWRPLTPLLVYLSPLSINISFAVITWTGLVLAAFFLYLLLREWGFTRRFRLYGLLFFGALYHAVAFNFWDFYLTDPLALAAFPLAFLLLHKQRYLPLAALITLAAGNKEVILLLFPTFLLMTLSSRKTKGVLPSLVTIVLVFLPAAGLTAAIRLLIEPVNDYSFLARAQLLVSQRFAEGLPAYIEQVGKWSFASWGSLAVLFLLNPLRRLKEVFLVRPWIAVFLTSMFLQLVFTADAGRLLVYAFPVMVPIGLITLSSLAQRLQVNDLPIAIILLVPHVALLFVYLTPGPTDIVAVIAVTFAMAALWVTLQALGLAGRGQVVSPTIDMALSPNRAPFSAD